MGKILLIEDDLALAMGIEYSLINEGYEVVKGGSVKEGRDAFSDDVDLVLLDVTLPDGTGYELCKEFRGKSDIPIIFLTALDEEANVVLGLDLGGDDYLTKPIRVRELIARINAVMRRRGKNVEKEQVQNRIIKVGELTIDPIKCEVKIKGEKTNLTSVEYKLLLLLAENKEAVLSRRVLLEKLWDIEGDFIEEKTLTVYIRRLREKLGEENYYIQTVRGLGYKLSEEE